MFFIAKKGPKLIEVGKDLNPFSIMEEFLLFKKAQGVTNFTISGFRSALRNFLADYKGNIKDSRKLKQAAHLFLADKKSGYYNKLLQALRQYFEYCIGEGVLKENPCDGLKYKRSGVRIVQHDEQTIRTFLDMPDQSTFSGLRDYTIMLAMLDTGIRPNELLQIRLEDIDFLNTQMIIREEYSKTRQMRIVPLSQKVITYIKKVLQARHPDWEKETPVLCSFSGHRLTSHNLQEKFRWYSNKLGANISPYDLRHTFALWFIRNEGNIFALQKIMGHTKLDMTRTYVELVQADIKGSHKKASPLNTLLEKQSKRVGKLKK